LGPDPESELEPDPDPLVRGTDWGIRIRTKMSRIPNTALRRYFFYLESPLSIRIRCRDTEGRKVYKCTVSESHFTTFLVFAGPILAIYLAKELVY
jgi:hypothetical protein